MKCSEFETRLHEILDERRLPECDAGLRSHADQCEECESLLQTQRWLFSVPTRRVGDTDGRHEAILRSGRPRRFAISTHRSPWLAATAASLIVIALGVLPWLNAISQPEPMGVALRDAGQEVGDRDTYRQHAEALRTAVVGSQADEAGEHAEPRREERAREVRENAVGDSIAVWRDISRTLLDGVSRDGAAIRKVGTTNRLIADHTTAQDGKVADGASAGASSGSLETATLESILEITSSWRPIADSLGETFASLRRLIPIPETGRAPVTQPGTSAIFGGAPVG
ncbi:MAG: hypothetical protein RIS70_4128 [Planctomycetota bacterium]